MNKHVHTSECKEILASLSEYIDGGLQAELCAQIDAHLKTCENCRVVVNTLRKTIELYERSNASAVLPGAVRERLFLRMELENYLKRDS